VKRRQARKIASHPDLKHRRSTKSAAESVLWRRMSGSVKRMSRALRETGRVAEAAAEAMAGALSGFGDLLATISLESQGGTVDDAQQVSEALAVPS